MLSTWFATALLTLLTGLATEAVITVIGPKFMAYALVALIISNVSVAAVPVDLQVWFFKYYPAMLVELYYLTPCSRHSGFTITSIEECAVSYSTPRTNSGSTLESAWLGSCSASVLSQALPRYTDIWTSRRRRERQKGSMVHKRHENTCLYSLFTGKKSLHLYYYLANIYTLWN